MLQFDERFFEEEERGGFRISSMMKRAWAVELEVLSQVTAVCKKHGMMILISRCGGRIT